MPLYLFKNPITDEIIEILQKMSDPHTYTNEDGIEFERIFTIPNANIDGTIDPFNRSKFLEKTKNKGSSGDLIDRSRDLSEARKAKSGGQDPVQLKYFDNWSSERNGKKHPKDPR